MASYEEMQGSETDVWDHEDRNIPQDSEHRARVSDAASGIANANYNRRQDSYQNLHAATRRGRGTFTDNGDGTTSWKK